MKVIKKGTANKHDLVHATCSHCGTNVTFWRNEPNTECSYIGTYDDGERFIVSWTCPVCDIEESKEMIYIKPVYEEIFGTIEGIEHNRVLTPEEKAEMEEALLIEE